MKKTILSPVLEQGRVNAGPFASPAGVTWGVFQAPVNSGRTIRIISSGSVDDIPEGAGWEHVSCSVVEDQGNPPTWQEMCRVKDLFWTDEETVLQFHPRKEDYVNQHPGVLHLWKPPWKIHLPPKALI